MTPPPSEKLLLEQLKSSNNAAFEKLFLGYYDGLVEYANKYLQDADAAEEIVQELFFNVWQKRSDLDITSSFASYLYRAARNACLNHIKHLKIRQTYQEHGKRVRDEEESRFSDTMEELELKQKIDVAVDSLPDARKQIFKMNRYEGLKYREIAEKLDLSMKTVEGQMSKALKYLREHLKDYMVLILIYSIDLFEKLFGLG